MVGDAAVVVVGAPRGKCKRRPAPVRTARGLERRLWNPNRAHSLAATAAADSLSLSHLPRLRCATTMNSNLARAQTNLAAQCHVNSAAAAAAAETGPTITITQAEPTCASSDARLERRTTRLGPLVILRPTPTSTRAQTRTQTQTRLESGLGDIPELSAAQAAERPLGARNLWLSCAPSDLAISSAAAARLHLRLHLCDRFDDSLIRGKSARVSEKCHYFIITVHSRLGSH